jgi:putative Holliday junction resolvase
VTIFPDATVLAFDFGTRRIGVAVGNTLIRQAQPLVTIEADSSETAMAALAGLVDAWRPTRLVVGVPTHADGTPHAMTAQARRFARELGERFGLPVALVDERWTTEAAQRELDAQRRGRSGRAQRDQVAAQLILQAWFDEPGATAPAP